MSGPLLRRALVVLAAVLLAAAGITTAQPKVPISSRAYLLSGPAGPEARARHVVILSFDGARADAVQQVMPETLLARAAYTWNAQTILPSVTLPAHASMLTGLTPDGHGVRFNTWVPGSGYLAAPTVFSIVTAQGGKAGAFVTKSKLLFLIKPGAAHAEYLPFPRYDQLAAVREAIRYLVREQPNLLFIHLADLDDAGHSSGWMSPTYMTAARRVPEAVAAVIDVLARMMVLDRSLVLVTADHGGHGRTHGTADPQDMTIPWLAFGAVSPGPIAQRVVIYDTAATALAALGIPVPSTWDGRPVLFPVTSRQ